jgi:nucleotide-binding universal stress UspA family protein
MYRHILLPTDGSDLSEKAIDHGVALAKALDADVTAVAVSPPSSATASESVIGLEALEKARQHLDVVRRAAAASAVTCHVLHLESDVTYQAIIAAAEKRGCDLIVMASHGRGSISAIVLGSVTAKVLSHSKIPVLIYPE